MLPATKTLLSVINREIRLKAELAARLHQDLRSQTVKRLHWLDENMLLFTERQFDNTIGVDIIFGD